ncbi:MAG TPA: diacylglycerol kinase family protein [Terriglobia bacterium]|nr:diacylglycerol kinase family protein [Terriglobia bacterium]
MGECKKIAAVVNPQSAQGRTARVWPDIARALGDRLESVTVRFTDSHGHAIHLTRELLRQGFDFIVAVGGDGTINEVANGFLEDDEPVRRGAQLGILPIGTGGDFRRTLGVSADPRQAIEILSTGVPLTIDLGKATFTGGTGATESRYFVNLVSFGMGGDVAAAAKNFLTPLGGKTAFLWATLTTFLAYRGKHVRLEVEKGAASLPFFITNVAIGNGQYHGGGMHPCPTAALNDGVLEVTVIDHLNMFELLRDIRILYSDNLYVHPKTHHFTVRQFSAEAAEPTKIEVDGEPLGALPLAIEVLPRRLPVVVSRSSPFL